ncbi:hypothetical protein GGI35DRAFT_458172, partial [Trichoderma velutinum]
MQTPFHPAMYMYQSSLALLQCPFRQLIPNLCCDMSFMELHFLSSCMFPSSSLSLPFFFAAFLSFFHALISLPTRFMRRGHTYTHAVQINLSAMQILTQADP